MPRLDASPSPKKSGQALTPSRCERGAVDIGKSARERAEWKLLGRVRERWHEVIADACRYSSVPVEFFGALVANESAGNPRAVRFEPAVYRHLKRVAEGKAAKYGGLTLPRLESEIEEMLHPKSDSYHAAFMTESLSADYAKNLAAVRDEALRELATSWGLTQIMGYHMVGRAGTVRDLIEPRFHSQVALGLLAEFAERYELDLHREFAEMFRCWNTGQPYGETFHPDYVEKGLRRMQIYRAII